MKIWSLVWLVAWLSVGGCAAQHQPIPFAHNDYEHPRPLLDALDHGFRGVEADLFLVNGELLVAHEKEKLQPGRTLAALYLEPLRKRVAAGGGRVHPEHERFWLMIDVKTEAASTYAALRRALEPYRDMLTRWRGDAVENGPITVILSGERAKDVIAAESERLLAIDGRLEDLDVNPPAALVPWISASWEKTFTWRGGGPMQPGEREKLRDIAGRAHAQGRLVRFWGTPERPEVWRELRAAGVDFINTDDLAGLARFLKSGPSN